MTPISKISKDNFFLKLVPITVDYLLDKILHFFIKFLGPQRHFIINPLKLNRFKVKLSEL